MKKLIAILLTTVFAIGTGTIAGFNESDIQASVITDAIAIETVKPDTAVKTSDASDGVDGFVTRLYNLCLNREPDPVGFQYWTSRLNSGEISARQCAYGFFFSTEFTNKANHLTDSSYVELFYNVFLGRQSDPTGKAYWINRISGTNYDTTVLFNGFVDSREFNGICESYGLVLGAPIALPNVARNVSSDATDAAPYSGGVSNGVPAAPSGGGNGGGGGAPAPAPSTPSAPSTPATPSQPANPDSQGGNPTTPTNTPTPAPTQPVTPVVTSNYDPDNHGGYWIVFPIGNILANQTIGSQSNYRKIADRTDFNAANQSCLGYVCSSGYVITYSQYSQMDWSQVSDPRFGAQTSTSDYYRGAYWANATVDDDTVLVATTMCGHSNGVEDAFATDSHSSGGDIVGRRVSSGGVTNGQTWGDKTWNGNSVTGNDYSRWATAMRAYTDNDARHSSELLAKYGITDEGLGDYIMIEWCEGNLTYNLQTLPLPDWSHFTGMGSDNAHSHFSTSVARTLPRMSRTWDYSSRSANVVTTSGGTDSGSNSGSGTTNPATTTQPTPAPANTPTTSTQPIDTTTTQPTTAPAEPTPAPTTAPTTTPAINDGGISSDDFNFG